MKTVCSVMHMLTSHGLYKSHFYIPNVTFLSYNVCVVSNCCNLSALNSMAILHSGQINYDTVWSPTGYNSCVDAFMPRFTLLVSAKLEELQT